MVAGRYARPLDELNPPQPHPGLGRMVLYNSLWQEPNFRLTGCPRMPRHSGGFGGIPWLLANVSSTSESPKLTLGKPRMQALTRPLDGEITGAPSDAATLVILRVASVTDCVLVHGRVAKAPAFGAIVQPKRL